MRRLEPIVVEVLRRAALWIERQPASRENGVCRAVCRSLGARFRGRASPLRNKVDNYIENLLHEFARDAVRHGPELGYWGMNFGAACNWRSLKRRNLWDELVDMEAAKRGRVLMLLFLAAAVEAGDMPA